MFRKAWASAHTGSCGGICRQDNCAHRLVSPLLARPSLALRSEPRRSSMCHPAELEPGAYVSDPETSRLFEVQDADQRQVHLIDVRSPIDDPTVIGMLTDNALK